MAFRVLVLWLTVVAGCSGSKVGTPSPTSDVSNNRAHPTSGSPTLPMHEWLAYINTTTGSTVELNEVQSPANNEDTVFQMHDDHVRFLFNGPVEDPPDFEGGFNIEATGNFAGDLLHLHQFTGNPPAGSHLLDAVADDVDVHVAHFHHTNPAGIALHVMGNMHLEGGVLDTHSAEALSIAPSSGLATQLSVGKSVVSAVGSGSNAIAFSTNGARLDLGTGANDYFSSNGTIISSPGGFTTSSTISSSIGSGSNGFSCTTNGCRVDLGGGANDYLFSDGSAVHTPSLFYAADYTTDTNGSAVSLQGRNVDNASSIGVKLGNSIALTTPGAKIVSFYSDAGATERSFIDYLGNLGLSGQTAVPTAPAADKMSLFGYQFHGADSPVLPATLSGNDSVLTLPVPLLGPNRWGCGVASGYGVSSVTTSGVLAAPSGTGTGAAVAFATTDERTRRSWHQLTSTAAINQFSGYGSGSTGYFWRGNAAGLGGFYWTATFALQTVTATSRSFMGIRDQGVTLSSSADPSAALNTAYFGCDSGQTTLRICSNDGAGAATCSDLGANFPCTTNSIAYDLALWAAPNDTGIQYYIRRLVNGSTATGTISSDLPSSTVAFGWDTKVNTGPSSAAAVVSHYGGVCYIAKPD